MKASYAVLLCMGGEEEQGVQQLLENAPHGEAGHSGGGHQVHPFIFLAVQIHNHLAQLLPLIHRGGDLLRQMNLGGDGGALALVGEDGAVVVQHGLYRVLLPPAAPRWGEVPARDRLG